MLALVANIASCDHARTRSPSSTDVARTSTDHDKVGDDGRVPTGDGQVEAKASAEQCAQAMNNILDIEFAGANAGRPELTANVAKQKAAVHNATFTEFMAACQDLTPRHVVECTINAKTIKQLAACDELK
jgi:hypothetical protein